MNSSENDHDGRVDNFKKDPELRSLIPPIQAEERELLRKNIREHGCRDPLVVWDGILLDGHNRFDICIELGVEYRTRAIELPDRDAAKVWIIRNQLGRRNLTDAQRIELAAKLEPLLREQGKVAQRRHGGTAPGRSKDTSDEFDKSDPIDTAGAVAEAAGVGRSRAREGLEVFRDADEEMTAEVRSGRKSIHAAHEELEKRRRRQEREQRGEPDPQAGHYRVLYVELPPQSRKTGAAKKVGPAIPSYAEVRRSPVGDCAAEDAVLFIRTPSSQLQRALSLGPSWKFSYRASFALLFNEPTPGEYNQVNHEMLLLFTRGKCLPNGAVAIASVQRVNGHIGSADGEVKIRELIDRLYPGGERIAFFADGPAEGWDAWPSREEQEDEPDDQADASAGDESPPAGAEAPEEEDEKEPEREEPCPVNQS